jgi:hypothetical protein
MHVLSIVGYIGGAAVLLWAAYAVFAGRRPWPARIWTTALALSALVLLWTACSYHLMAFRTSY